MWKDESPGTIKAVSRISVSLWTPFGTLRLLVKKRTALMEKSLEWETGKIKVVAFLTVRSFLFCSVSLTWSAHTNISICDFLAVSLLFLPTGASRLLVLVRLGETMSQRGSSKKLKAMEQPRGALAHRSLSRFIFFFPSRDFSFSFTLARNRTSTERNFGTLIETFGVFPRSGQMLCYRFLHNVKSPRCVLDRLPYSVVKSQLIVESRPYTKKNTE